MYIWKEKDSKNAVITNDLEHIFNAIYTDGVNYVSSTDISDYIVSSGVSENDTVKFNKRNVITLTIKKVAPQGEEIDLYDCFEVTNIDTIPGTISSFNSLFGNNLMSDFHYIAGSFGVNIIGRKLSYGVMLPLVFKFNFEGINTNFDEEPICDGIVDFNFVYDEATNTVRTPKESDFNGTTLIYKVYCEPEGDNIYRFYIDYRTISNIEKE